MPCEFFFFSALFGSLWSWDSFMVLLKASFCVQSTMRPNKWKAGVWSSEGLMAGPSKETGWFVLKKFKLPDRFQQSIFKGQLRAGASQGVGPACAVLWLAEGEVTGRWHRGSNYQSLGARRSGLPAHDHQVVNFFHVVVLLASEKYRKYAWDTVTWVLQRGATAEVMREQSVPGRPHRILLSYNVVEYSGGSWLCSAIFMLWNKNDHIIKIGENKCKKQLYVNIQIWVW